MAYVIQAVIAKAGGFGDALPAHLRSVALPGGMEMIPLGEDARAYYEIPYCPLTDEDDAGTPAAPPPLLRLCETLSRSGTIAYIEAEFFGGLGQQAHLIFAQGRQCASPLVAQDAINQALRALGAGKGSAIDEFAALGLGRHRNTDAWLAG